MVAASSHNPTPRQNSRFKKSAKEGNATGRKRTFYKVKKKGVNSIDLDGEEYLIVDEGEISEIQYLVLRAFSDLSRPPIRT